MEKITETESYQSDNPSADTLTRESLAATFTARITGAKECEITNIDMKEPEDDPRLEEMWVMHRRVPSLIIPGEMEGYLVTSIADGTYSDFRTGLNVSTIVFPDSVRRIGNYCFRYIKSLRFIFLNQVETLGEGCFCYHEEQRYRADKIPELTVFHRKELQYPKSCFVRQTTVDDFEEYADWGPVHTGSDIVTHPVSFREPDAEAVIEDGRLTALFSQDETVILPPGIKAIGPNAFFACPSMKQVILPDSLEEIEQEAFSGCSLLEGITFPKQLKRIGKFAFEFCPGLRSVQLPEDVEEMEEGIFACCPGLERASLPTSMVRLPDYTFLNCLSLKETNLRDNPNLQALGDWSLANCPSLKDKEQLKKLKYPGCGNLE